MIGGFESLVSYEKCKANINVQHCAFLELRRRGYVEYVRRKVNKN